MSGEDDYDKSARNDNPATKGASKMGKQIVIIGAGLAGLAAARLLYKEGHNPILLDKGRRIGGRCGTRRVAGHQFNHGAQFITAVSTEFSALCQQAVASGALAEWDIGRRLTSYAGQPAMRSLPSWMAEPLDVRQQVEIAHITKQDNHQLQLTTTQQEHFAADRLIVTAPAPQTTRLLAEVAPALSAAAATARYAPCWTVMAGFEAPLSGIPAYGTDISDIISWYTSERARPSADQGRRSLTIQASGAWSEAHLEEEADAIADRIFNDFKQITGLKTSPELLQAHRWRYAKVTVPVIVDHSRDAVIFTAGDWCPPETANTGSDSAYRPTGSRAEDAFLSGISAAQAALKTL